MSPYIFIRVGVRPRSAWVTLMQPGRCKATRQCHKFGPKVEIWAMESNVVDDAVCMGRFIMFRDLLPSSMLHGASVFICEDISVVGGCCGVCLSLRCQPAETWTPWEVERLNQMLVSQKTSVCSLPLRQQQLNDAKLRHIALVIVHDSFKCECRSILMHTW